MLNWKSGVVAAGGAVAASFVILAGAGSWVARGFAQNPTATAVAGSWAQQTAANSAALAQPKIGDENFWLSTVTRPVSPVADAVPRRIAAGDRISINLKASGVQDLDVIGVTAIDAGVLPVIAGGAPAVRMILVTCKPAGDDAAGAALVRVILDDTPTGAAAVAGAVQKAL